MKHAQRIAATATDAAQAMDLAQSSAIAEDQNWPLELTRWTFDDGSILAVSGTSVTVIDADDAQSIRAYARWAGMGDAAEVARLLGALDA